MEASSSSSTSCSDLALANYLQSYYISSSSSSSTSCFDLALDLLKNLGRYDSSDDEIKYPVIYYSWHGDIKFLEAEVLLLKTLFLYVRKCRRRKHEAVLEHDQEEEDNGYTMSQSLRRSIICFRIQNVVASIIHDLNYSSLLRPKRSFEWEDNIRVALARSGENIKLLLGTDIKEQCISFMLDYYSPGDPRLVMDLLDSLSVILEGPRQKKQKWLILSRNLVRFATKRGVKRTQLIDLFSHIEAAAANLISICRFDRCNGQVFDEISQHIHKKIPHVQEIYIHVLMASKLSGSSYASAPKGTEHAANDFIDSLVDYLEDLLKSYDSFPDLVKHQMLNLYHRLKFLSKAYLGKFLVMLDLIGVVCDAGILFFSLSIDEKKEGLPKETHLILVQFFKVFKYVKAEYVHNIFSLRSTSSSFSFPKTYELGSIDFFLENLKQLAGSDETNDSIAFSANKIQIIQKDLKFLRSFLEEIKEQSNRNEGLQAFWSRVMEVAYKAEFVIDLTIVGDELECHLDAVARDINLMKIEAQEIYGSIRYDGDTKTFTRIPSQVTLAIYNEDLIGLDEKVKTITQRLTMGSKQLDIVPIVGMPGLGKTTLADQVYGSSSVISYFHVRAWCCVSQTYSKHNLLVQILSCIDSGNSSQYIEKDEDSLVEKLKKALLRNRYLLVLDDLWDVDAWKLLQRSLPDDANGSRIIFTSRFQNLSLHFKPDSKPYHLRHLTDEESWKLLQKKLFGKERCPPTLFNVGSQIAKNCSGLPLTVVLVAGILATTAQDCWEEVQKSLCSIVLDNEYCMKTLELSYNYLPDYLKPCLLYLGAFIEDADIPVRGLLWLWTSEGLVQQTEGMGLDKAAENYLMALISRCLVMVAKQRTMGGAKACRLHDLASAG